jgi:hypothetical protein
MEHSQDAVDGTVLFGNGAARILTTGCTGAFVKRLFLFGFHVLVPLGWFQAEQMLAI